MIGSVLTRKDSGDTGTFGTLVVGDNSFITGELPWRDNAVGKSCIPEGTYTVKWQPSPRFGHKYHVQDVPGRTDILIHVANLMGDSDRGLKHEVDGCIALGLSRGIVNGQYGIINSATAVKRFEDLMGQADFTMTVVNSWPSEVAVG